MAKLLPYAHLFDYAKCNVLLDVAWLNEFKPLLFAKVYILNYDYNIVYVVYLFLLEFL